MTPSEIRTIRTAAKLSQSQLGERCGVSRFAVLNWETGKHKPPAAAIEQLATMRPAALAVPLNPKNHPELYVKERTGRRVVWHRRLAHPFWYATLKPWRDANPGYAGHVGTEADLANYAPVTAADALRALVDVYGMPEAEAKAELSKRGEVM